MHLELFSIPGRAGISARAVLTEVAELSGDQALLARIRKAKVVGQTAIPDDFAKSQKGEQSSRGIPQ